MTALKRYLVFSFEDHNYGDEDKKGGFADFIFTSDNEGEAIGYLEQWQLENSHHDQYQIVDSQESERLILTNRDKQWLEKIRSKEGVNLYWFEHHERPSFFYKEAFREEIDASTKRHVQYVTDRKVYADNGELFIHRFALEENMNIAWYAIKEGFVFDLDGKRYEVLAIEGFTLKLKEVGLATAPQTPVSPLKFGGGND